MKATLSLPTSDARKHVSFCVFMLLLTCASAVRVQAQVSFYQTPTIPFGGGVTADINGDGKPDLLGFDGTVLLGKGDGTFTQKPSLHLTGFPPIGIGDVNDDGKPDVVAVNGNNLGVYLGNGDGTFQPVINTDVGSSFSYLGVSDVNGDGKADVVAVNNSGVFVFLGQGNGTFNIGAHYSMSMNTYQVVFGDFNGDGKLDVAIATLGFVSVLLGNGDGTFKPPVTSTGVAVPIDMAAGDINGDGKLDLVLENLCSGSCSPTVYSLLGNGDGTFGAPGNPLVSLDYGLLSLIDLNGDGKADLVEASFSAQVFLSNGDGSFRPGRSYYLDAFLFTPTNIVSADFTNDGKSDVVIRGKMMLGNGDGTFQAQPAAAPGGVAAATGDFNRDGNPDLAVLSGSAVQIFLGDGTGVFSLAHTYSFTQQLTQGPASITSVDLNGDGNLDLIIPTIDTAAQTWSLTVFLGNGDGSFGSEIITMGGSGIAPLITVADFNSDKKPDVAAIMDGGTSGSADSLYVLLGNGDGTFAAAVSYYAGSITNSVVAADFNNDSKIDVAVSDFQVGDTGPPSLALLLGNGDGTFQPVKFLPNINVVSATADLNGDGNADLVSTGIIYMGNGNGTFQTVPQPQLGDTIVAVSDINGDGKLDLVLVGYSLSVALGYGDGTFGNPIVIDTVNCRDCDGGNIDFSAVADFSRGHLPDIAMGGNETFDDFEIVTWRNTTQGQAGLDFQISASAFSPGSVTAGASATSTVTTTPLNGFNRMVSLSCSISPTVTPAPTCTLPSSVQMTGGKVAQVQLTVATIGPMTTEAVSRPDFPPGSAPYVWTAVLLASAILFVGRRLPAMARPLMVLAFLSLVGCGGGGGGSSSHTAPGTPSGTYTVTVTAKASTVSSNTNLTIVVQ